MKFKSLYFLITVAILWVSSCVKEENPYTIPYAPVYFQIDVNGLDSDLSFFDYKTFTQGRTIGEQTGYGGLLVFRTIDGAIYAYDLCCPYEDKREIIVTPQDNGKARCASCGSVFVTMYGLGTNESGVSTEPLQKYSVKRISQRDGAYVITN